MQLTVGAQISMEELNKFEIICLSLGDLTSLLNQWCPLPPISYRPGQMWPKLVDEVSLKSMGAQLVEIPHFIAPII